MVLSAIYALPGLGVGRQRPAILGMWPGGVNALVRRVISHWRATAFSPFAEARRSPRSVGTIMGTRRRY